MDWRHDVEAKDLSKASEAELADALIIQERELEMEWRDTSEALS
jgi:hypothetical protein